MTLLEALSDVMTRTMNSAIPHARMAHFAFADNGQESAYLSQVELEELVPLLEAWCAQQRVELEQQQPKVERVQ